MMLFKKNLVLSLLLCSFSSISHTSSSILIEGGLENTKQLHNFDNYFSRVGVLFNLIESQAINLGLEFAVKTGLTGPLLLSDEEADELGGTTPIILATPRMNASAVISSQLLNNHWQLFGKIGGEFAYFKTDRCDIDTQAYQDMLLGIGVNYKLSDKSKLYFLATKNILPSQIDLGISNTIDAPTSSIAVAIGYQVSF